MHPTDTTPPDDSQCSREYDPYDSCCRMRHFLDAGLGFSWRNILETFGGTPGFGTLSKEELHCDLTEGSNFKDISSPTYERYLIDPKSRLTHSVKTFVYQTRLNAKYAQATGWHAPFAIKKNHEGQEVEVMKDLRHPHVAALLATFRFERSIHIVSYPAGCCDLGDFMHCISENLNLNPWSKRTTTRSEDGPYLWPFKAELHDQLGFLKRFMACICRALEYLHMVGVRHRDIKPENIVIDIYGNVVLTDFGCSKRYNTDDLVSRGPLAGYTPKYKVPEVERDRRDRKSDVWSLGCVFVEIITLLRQRSLDRLKLHYETNGGVLPYNENPALMIQWLRDLRTHESNGTPGAVSLNTCSAAVEKMLELDIDKRLNSENLYKFFTFPDQPICQDCHPESPSEWVKGVPAAEKAKWALRKEETESQERTDRESTSSKVRASSGPVHLRPQPLQQPRQIAAVLTGSMSPGSSRRLTPHSSSAEQTSSQSQLSSSLPNEWLPSAARRRRNSTRSNPPARTEVVAQIGTPHLSESAGSVEPPTQSHQSGNATIWEVPTNVDDGLIIRLQLKDPDETDEARVRPSLSSASQKIKRLVKRSVPTLEHITPTKQVVVFEVGRLAKPWGMVICSDLKKSFEGKVFAVSDCRNVLTFDRPAVEYSPTTP